MRANKDSVEWEVGGGGRRERRREGRKEKGVVHKEEERFRVHSPNFQHILNSSKQENRVYGFGHA